MTWLLEEENDAAKYIPISSHSINRFVNEALSHTNQYHRLFVCMCF